MQFYRSKIFNSAVDISEIIPELGGSAVATDIQYGIETNLKYNESGDVIESDVFYWDVTWKISDRTWSQLSTLTNINANLSTAPLPQPFGDFRVFACIDDSLSTPQTTLVDMDVEYTEDNTIQNVGCLIKVEVSVPASGSASDIPVIAQLCDQGSSQVSWRNKILEPTVINRETNNNGEAFLELAPNIELSVANTHWLITVGTNAGEKYTIPPDTASIYLTELTPV